MVLAIAKLLDDIHDSSRWNDSLWTQFWKLSQPLRPFWFLADWELLISRRLHHKTSFLALGIEDWNIHCYQRAFPLFLDHILGILTLIMRKFTADKQSATNSYKIWISRLIFCVLNFAWPRHYFQSDCVVIPFFSRQSEILQNYS